MKVIKNATVFMNGGFNKSNILFDDKIHAFSDCATAEEVVIPDGAFVLPGFIDQHIHGAGGGEAADCTEKALSQISNALVKSGTTSYLVTTVTEEKERLKQTLKLISDFMAKNTGGSQILGVHMEGPFLNIKYKGAMREEFILAPDTVLFDEFYDSSNGTVKMVTLAPEMCDNNFIAHLVKKGATVSIGHSEATHEQVLNAVKNGATCITHTFNAQSPFRHREIGVAGSALLIDELYSELIADTCHVSVPAMKILVKNKPSDKLILITDSLRAQGMGEGLSELYGEPVIVKDGSVRLKNGTLAGSVVPMNKMIYNIINKVGVKTETAIKYATENPAKNLGVFDHKGSIEVGKDADFAVVDKDFNVFMTIIAGQITYVNKGL